MMTTNTEEITTLYNETGHHEATASLGKEWVTCNGLGQSGEAWFDSNCEDSENYDDLRAAALVEVKKKWNYNGSQWSAPVDEPDEMPSDEGDWLVSRTEFHGGAEIGRFTSESAADAWIEWKTQGTDCICGCYIAQESPISQEGEE